MPAITLSSRQFNQDTGHAKRAAKDGPVFITDRGVPAHVLLSIDDYYRLAGGSVSLIDQLGSPAGIEDVDLETTMSREHTRPADIG